MISGISQTGSVDGRPWPEVAAEIINLARAIYPSAVSDLDAVCMMASHQMHAVRERNEAMNLNAHQAQMIAAMKEGVE